MSFTCKPAWILAALFASLPVQAGLCDLLKLVEPTNAVKFSEISFATLSQDGQLALILGVDYARVWYPRGSDNVHPSLSVPYVSPSNGYAVLSRDASRVMIFTKEATDAALQTWYLKNEKERPRNRQYAWKSDRGIPYLLNEDLALSFLVDRGLQIWDLNKMARGLRLADTAPSLIDEAVLAPRGTYAALRFSGDHGGRVVNLATGETVRNIFQGWTAFSFSPTSQTFVHGTGDGFIDWHLVSDGQAIASFPTGNRSRLRDLIFIDEVTLLSNEGTAARIWHLEAREQTPRTSLEIDVTNDTVVRMVLSPNKKWFATTHLRGEIILWDSVTGHPLAELSGHQEMVHAVQFSEDSSTVLTSDITGSIRLWDIDPTMKPTVANTWHTEYRRLKITREVDLGKTLIRIEGRPSL